MDHATYEVAQFTLHDSWDELKRYANLRPKDVRDLGSRMGKRLECLTFPLTPVLTPLRAARLHAKHPWAFARDSTCVYAELETCKSDVEKHCKCRRFPNPRGVDINIIQRLQSLLRQRQPQRPAELCRHCLHNCPGHWPLLW